MKSVVALLVAAFHAVPFARFLEKSTQVLLPE
jgi:hypothetical protein